MDKLMVEHVANAIKNAPKERHVDSQTMDISTGRIVEEKITFRTTYELKAISAIEAIDQYRNKQSDDPWEPLRHNEENYTKTSD